MCLANNCDSFQSLNIGGKIVSSFSSSLFKTAVLVVIVTVFMTVLSFSPERKNLCPDGPTDEKSVQEWYLRDVIFVEDKRNIPVGKVVKVHAVVAHSQSTQNRLQ